MPPTGTGHHTDRVSGNHTYPTPHLPSSICTDRVSGVGTIICNNPLRFTNEAYQNTQRFANKASTCIHNDFMQQASGRICNDQPRSISQHGEYTRASPAKSLGPPHRSHTSLTLPKLNLATYNIFC